MTVKKRLSQQTTTQQKQNKRKEVLTMLKTATCQCCNTIHPTAEMVKTALPKRGNANAYMCHRCAEYNQGYHSQSNKNRGTQKVNAVAVGIELETAYTTDNARNQLFAYGLIPTNDCSLSGARTCEYVSGIIKGLNIPSKLAVSIETLMQNGELQINNSCGTHFHVSINNMKNDNGEQVYMNYIARFYHSLFLPLTQAMKANPTATKAVFGRYFQDDYCKAITENSSPAYDRYLFINVLNPTNIEFRLNKYQNAKQFQNLMKMEVEMVQTIVTNFCEHFNDENIDTRRYANKTAYRKHKASVTANKLVKIFKKYANI